MILGNYTVILKIDFKVTLVISVELKPNVIPIIRKIFFELRILYINAVILNKIKPRENRLSDVLSYRPISFLPIHSKLIEKPYSKELNQY